jgi:hypothetical protein
MMGAGIAAVAALAGHRVVLIDRGAAEVERGLQQARTCVDQLRDNGLAGAEAAARVTGLLGGSTDMAAGCRSARLVIEAVTENLALKQKLFRELNRWPRRTPSSPATPRAADHRHRRMCECGRSHHHFWFSPGALVEVVMGAHGRKRRWLRVLLGWGKCGDRAQGSAGQRPTTSRRSSGGHLPRAGRQPGMWTWPSR